MPRIRYGGWLRSLDRRLDDLELRARLASPGTRSSAESAGTAAAEGFLSLSGWGFAQAIASRSSSSACFTKGHRLGAIGCAGGAPGHASAWGPGSGRTRAQRCQSSRSIRPRLRNLCAHWGGKSFPPSPRARVRSTLGPDRNLPHAASLARFPRVRLSSSAGHAPLRPRRTRLGSPRGATPRFGPRHRDEITSPTRHDEVTLSPQRY